DRDVATTVKQVGGAVDGILGWHDRGTGRPNRRYPVRSGVGQRHVTGNHHHGDSLSLDRRTHRDLEHVRELTRVTDELAVHRGLAEQLLRVGLLEVAGAD